MNRCKKEKGKFRKNIAFLMLIMAALVIIFPTNTKAMTGSGTWESPYKIYNCADLQQTNNIGGTYFELANDIDCTITGTWNSGAGFIPIGNFSTPFRGQFDGKGHKISNLTINRPSTDFVGLFGYVGGGAKIANLALINVNITGQNYVGAFIGSSNNSILEVAYATGNVTGKGSNVGGLLGYIANYASATNTYSAVNVSGNRYVGGHVGYLASSAGVYNSYAKGNVTGTNDLGGLVGYKDGSGVYNSFYDKETSGQSDTGKGNGLNTANMKAMYNYTGWDFTNTWIMNVPKTDGYPKLRNVMEEIPPTMITTCTELQNMKNDLSDTYVLANDIDCSASNTWNGGLGFKPIGDNVLQFRGKFDGKGFVIKNLTIYRTSENYIGLFGYTVTATLNHVALENANITGSQYVGGIVGRAINETSIKDSYATGSVSGSSQVGGLAGENYQSVIIDSNSKVNVNGTTYIGGLTGYSANSSSVTNSYAEGVITGSNHVGGLIGENSKSPVTNSYATGKVTGVLGVGGLIGVSSDTILIQRSYATGDVVATGDHVGGFIGYNYNSSTVKDVYATGDVKGRDYVGGAIGRNNASNVTNAYSTGLVVAQATRFGGLIGDNAIFNITNSYYDKELARQNDNTLKGVPYTTIQMKTQSNYVGWDFSSVWIMNAPNTDGYPKLRSNLEEIKYTMISTCTDLQNIEAKPNDYYALKNNIDCSATTNWNGAMGFVPIGNAAYPFTGILDGRGYKVKNLTINRTSETFIGLFAYVRGGTIQNIGLENMKVLGRTYVGGLVGYAHESTQIKNVYATGEMQAFITAGGGLIGYGDKINVSDSYANVKVSGGAEIGGLAGIIDKESEIMNSYTLGTVNATEATSNVGGLVGSLRTSSKIISSYATGNVQGQSYVGGLVGESTGYTSIINSHAKGTVIANNSYAGGLVGRILNYSTIKQSYATGNVTVSYNYVGGLVAQQDTGVTITDSYATGNAEGVSYVGSFVGITQTTSTISNSYANGKVIAYGYPVVGVGGFAGYKNGTTITNSYYNQEITELSDTARGTPLTTVQMKTQSSYTGWNFSTIWTMNQPGSDGYPKLIENPQIVPDTTPPVGVLTASNTAWTNANVIITAVGTDAGSGIKQIKRPDGTYMLGSPITYMVSSNGTYTFEFEDNAGNITIKSIVVSNIDKTAPTTPTLSASTTGLTNGNVSVTISYPVDASIKEYRIDGGAWTNYTAAVVMTANGKVEARGKDAAGNYSSIGILTLINIDKTPPAVATFNPSITTPINGNVSLTITYPNDTATRQYKIGSGGVWSAYSTAITVSSNNTIYARSYDLAGNVSAESNYVVSNIDKTAPTTPTLSATPTTPTNGNVSVTISYSGDSTVKEYRINSGVWLNYTSAVSMTDNGKVEARGKDTAGNYSAIGFIDITNIDKTPPASATFSATPTAPTNGNVSVTITYPADATTKQYKLGSGGTWTTYTTAVSITTNNTIYARSYDAAGNISAESSYVISNIDKTAPTTPTLSATPTTPTNGNVSVTITYSGDSTVKEYRINSGVWLNYTSAVSMTDNGKVEARGKDSAGNYSTIGSIDITNIDKTPPASATFSATPSAPTNGNVSVTITYPADATTKQYKLGSGGTWTTYTTAVSVTANNTIYARSYDATGNISAESSYAISNIDKTAPTMPTLSATPTTPTNGVVNVTITYSGDSTTKEYRINGGDWISYPSIVVMTANGKVEARGKDNAGNNSAIGFIDITNIDKTPPASATFSATPMTPTNGNVSVTITYPGDAITKEYKIGSGGTWMTYTTTVSITANNTVYARSYDAAGNVSAESSYVVSNIDKTAPTIALNPSSRTWAVSDVSVAVTLADTGGSVYKQYRYQWTNTTTKPTSGWSSWNTGATPTLTRNVEGIWYLHVEAQDNAGNTAYVYGGTYKMDKSAPLLTVDFEQIIEQKVYSVVGTKKALFTGAVSENNLENQVEVYYYVQEKETGEKITEEDILLLRQSNNVDNTTFEGEFEVKPEMKNGMYTLIVYAKNHLGLMSSEQVDFEIMNVVNKPTVDIHINPQPTGTWANQPIDAYITDSGDFDLLVEATKKYEVTNNPIYPTNFTKVLPPEQKVSLNLVGLNYLHIQYTLKDGTIISSTAGPYLIDTSEVSEFTVSLQNTNGEAVTNWSNKDLTLVINDPSTLPISGINKQYRIENYHSEWQTYKPGTKISLEGTQRIFARIVTKAGKMSEQQVVFSKIDKTLPSMESLTLEITGNNTYAVSMTGKDTLSGIQEVKLNTMKNLDKVIGNRYTASNLAVKPISISATDYAGNTLSGVAFAAEPNLSFEAPYTLTTEVYREDVKAFVSGGNLSYELKNKLYICSNDPCTITIHENGSLKLIQTDGIKQTIREVTINNINQSILELFVNGERDSLDPTKIHIRWNYTLQSGNLICIEGGVKKTYAVTGAKHVLQAKNFTYDCYIEATYGGEWLVSNRVIIHPNEMIPREQGIDVQRVNKKVNVYIEESKIGTSYIINAKKDNYKSNEIDLPMNRVFLP